MWARWNQRLCLFALQHFSEHRAWHRTSTQYFLTEYWIQWQYDFLLSIVMGFEAVFLLWLHMCLCKMGRFGIPVIVNSFFKSLFGIKNLTGKNIYKTKKMWDWKVRYNMFLCWYRWEKRRLQRTWSYFIDPCKVTLSMKEGNYFILWGLWENISCLKLRKERFKLKIQKKKKSSLLIHWENWWTVEQHSEQWILKVPQSRNN